MQGVGSLYLSYLGFDYHTISETSSISYWTYHLPDDDNNKELLSPSKPPIFFVHGIGIGISMYYNIVRALVANDPNRAIIILELPNISLKVMSKIPTTEETVEAIDHIFRVNNLTEVGCSWLAHSYGTIVTTWVIKDRPHYVKKITFVDSVCFALWEPDLIYNFLYRVPSSPIQRLAQFFVAQDLVVASTLFKNFCWLRNLLFPEDIQCEADVFVSSHDYIVDPVGTYNYLKKHNEQTKGNKIRITKMHGLSHGSFLSSNKYTGDIMSCL
jgi:pimeloyl-ACP methyl ester carboxylesterase